MNALLNSFALETFLRWTCAIVCAAVVIAAIAVLALG
jgi:hypothetical protein